MRPIGSVLFIVGMVGCGSNGGECGEAECAAICEGAATPEQATPDAPKAGAATTLSDFEKSLVEPMLKDIRDGVRPFGENAVTLCKGTSRDCEESLGTSPGELAPGKYIVKAELRVPKTSQDADTWQVKFSTDCTITSVDGKSTSQRSYDKSYNVRYAGEERGYNLVPLRIIESPRNGGSEVCEWKIEDLHGDGDRVIASGTWTVPAA